MHTWVARLPIRNRIAIVPHNSHTYDRVHQRSMNEKQDFSCTHPLCDHNPTPHRTKCDTDVHKTKEPNSTTTSIRREWHGGPGCLTLALGDIRSPNKTRGGGGGGGNGIRDDCICFPFLLFLSVPPILDWLKWECVCAGPTGVQSLWVCWLASKICVCSNSSTYGYMAMHVYVLYHMLCIGMRAALLCACS